MTQFTALLPMRHESERVPGKNYRDFGGKPLFRHVLESLLANPSISLVAIDTDSPTISDMVRDLDHVRVIPRPERLLGGDVPMNAIIEYDISLLPGEHFLQTHSTNPLFTTESFKSLTDRYLAGLPVHDSAFTATRRQQRFWTKDAKPVNHDPKKLLRTQDLEGLYEENSCAYVFSRSSFASSNARIGMSPILVETDPLESLDIDTEADWQIALAVYNHKIYSCDAKSAI